MGVDPNEHLRRRLDFDRPRPAEHPAENPEVAGGPVAAVAAVPGAGLSVELDDSPDLGVEVEPQVEVRVVVAPEVVDDVEIVPAPVAARVASMATTPTSVDERRAHSLDDLNDAIARLTVTNEVTADERFRIQAPAPTKRRQPKTRWLWLMGLVLAIAAVAYERPGVWLPFLAVAVGVPLAYSSGWRGHDLRMIAFALALFTATVDYLSWRVTIVNWPMWWIAVPLLLAEFHAAVHTVGFHVTLWPRQQQPLNITTDPTRRPIFIFVPTVSEGPEVVQATLRGILAAKRRYRREHKGARVTVVVCNDGLVAGQDCSDDVIAMARKMRVRCITRTVGGGFKAGNVEHARQLVGATGDAIIVIFDADQVPQDDILLALVPPLGDTNVGWVQTGQFYRNRENRMTRWSDDEQAIFYRLLCPGKSVHESAFMCGTNMAIRATALDEIGGLPTDTITEDFIASIRLAGRWRSVFVAGLYATGLGPMDTAGYIKQQRRWASGTLETLRMHFGLIFVPGRGNLSAQQRFQYGLAATHYFAGLRTLTFMLAPILYIFLGISCVRGATLGAFIIHFMPYFVIGIAALVHAGWGLTTWRGVVLGVGSFSAQIRAVVNIVFGKRATFFITPKKRMNVSPWRTAWPQVMLVLLALAALIDMALFHHSAVYYFAGFWLALMMSMFVLYLDLVRRDARALRLGVDEEFDPAKVDLPTDPLVRARALQLRGRSLAWARWRKPVLVMRAPAALVGVGAVLLVVFATGFGPFQHHPTPPTMPVHPRIGLSSVETPTSTSDLTNAGLTPTMTGAAAEIGSSFDVAWANQAISNGGAPYLTLFFTQNGTTTLDTGLTAIANGADDAALQRWAKEIKSWNHPLYLTVLPLADRNYAASSGVAGGGIPADVSRAWDHVWQVFQDEGASNVAWVWTPADAAKDQLYSPPENEIDAVGLPLFVFPGGTFPDAAAILKADAARHPGKPFLIDTSVGGTATQRVAWMSTLTKAIVGRHDILGVVYHDSGPFAPGQSSDAPAWSVGHDPVTLAAITSDFATIAAQTNTTAP